MLGPITKGKGIRRPTGQGLFYQNSGDREKVVKENNTATIIHQQRTITTIFGSITHAISQSRATAHIGSSTQNLKEVAIY